MSDLEITSQVVSWLSLGVTTVGLGGLITQASAINAQLDPFHASRTPEYLGLWLHRQARFPWYRIAKPAPQGPRIEAGIVKGFCSINNIHVARIPLVRPTGKAGWSTILGMFNAQPPQELPPPDIDNAEKGVSLDSRPRNEVDESFNNAWEELERRPLHRHQTMACISISRVTFITMLAATNGRPAFHYVDASGYRAGFASYCGQWYVTWPIGQDAIIKFVRHDSLGDSEVFPRSFPQRIDRCGQMMCGVVTSRSSGLNLAFCGRKAPGIYRLEHAPRGFQNAHGARHLYNMMGGKAYEVDFMIARPAGQTSGDDGLVLSLPSVEKHGSVRMVIPAAEEELIKHALDCLPWTFLSWSSHRGMRDILLAYAKPMMDAHRAELARLLAKTITDKPHLFTSKGWDTEFVRSSMAQMASSAVLAGSGNSGDAVRVVTAAALEAVGADRSVAQLDDITYWRRGEKNLDADGVVALTKVFVLEWSIDIDYQMYHDLPISLYFG